MIVIGYCVANCITITCVYYLVYCMYDFCHILFGFNLLNEIHMDHNHVTSLISQVYMSWLPMNRGPSLAVFTSID